MESRKGRHCKHIVKKSGDRGERIVVTITEGLIGLERAPVVHIA